jgi:hypothetical protein
MYIHTYTIWQPCAAAAPPYHISFFRQRQSEGLGFFYQQQEKKLK